MIALFRNARRAAVAGLTLCSILAGCGAPSAPPDSEIVARNVSEPIIVSDNAGFGRAINAFRAEDGLDPLTWSPALEAAARRHARDMAETGALSHRGSDNSAVGDRARAEGYAWCQIAENIAFGYADQATVLEGWKSSPGHRRNLLLKGAQDFGLAQVQQDYWVLVLGRDADC